MIYQHDFGNTRALRARALPRHEQATPEHRPSNRRAPALAVTLMVGFITSPVLALAKSVQNNTLHLTASQFFGLPQAEFAKLTPRLVLSPLIKDGHDALEFARKLESLGYRGRYRALVRHLPDVSLVANEVRNAVPSVNFGVTELGPLGVLAAYVGGEGAMPPD